MCNLVMRADVWPILHWYCRSENNSLSAKLRWCAELSITQPIVDTKLTLILIQSDPDIVDCRFTSNYPVISGSGYNGVDLKMLKNVTFNLKYYKLEIKGDFKIEQDLSDHNYMTSLHLLLPYYPAYTGMAV